MRRRALAAHIPGLILFATKNDWTEVLKRHLMMSPPEGYRRVSWAQLRAADQALYSYIAVRCEAGTKAKTGESVTEFERHFKEGMKSPEILQLLAFLQGADAPRTGWGLIQWWRPGIGQPEKPAVQQGAAGPGPQEEAGQQHRHCAPQG